MGFSPQRAQRAQRGAVLCALCALCGGAVSGCRRPAAPPSAVPWPAVLGPDRKPGEWATLRLGAPPTAKRQAIPAVEFEVRIVRGQQGHDTVLKLVSQGEVVEREVYESRAEAFRVVAAGDDGFAPPLDLVRYPARGDAWDWKGKLVYAGVSRAATARVTVGQEGDETRSEVALSIANGAGPPLERRFSFGIRKGQGVVRRTFGDVSSRRPLGEMWQP